MIADQYLQLRSELETALGELLKLGSKCAGHLRQLDTLHALLTDIREPLLFVAMGEVKSGKSSLLNALFGQEFAKVDVLPATDRVYIFRYDAAEKSVEVSPQVTERYLPIPFLRDFNVVDTPGTNTMVPGHQMITENFVPRADFSSLRLLRSQSLDAVRMDFLGLLQKKWLKNMVFVLQQIDLRERARLKLFGDIFKKTALRRLGFVPPIFAVSARKALLRARPAWTRSNSGRERFGPLEEQINLIVTESSARMLKLRSTSQTARVMLEQFIDEIRESYETIARDEARLSRVDFRSESPRDSLFSDSRLTQGSPERQFAEEACPSAPLGHTLARFRAENRRPAAAFFLSHWSKRSTREQPRLIPCDCFIRLANLVNELLQHNTRGFETLSAASACVHSIRSRSD